jgi:transposase
MTRGSITLSSREQQRAHVIAQFLEKRLTVADAARLMGLSTRHTKRLVANVRRVGLATLAHGNRGRPPARRLPDSLRERLITLARTIYAGCNDSHLTELLAEHHQLRLSRPTVQRWLRAAGIPSPHKRRPPKHRRRRDRMPQAGLLVQLDGSPHPWLEDRGPRFVLQAAIDDATGIVLAAVFRPQEDIYGYLLLLRHLVRRYGIPAAAYTDRHRMFHAATAALSIADELEGRTATTQLPRALRELGIRWIPAASPQGTDEIVKSRPAGVVHERAVR